MSRYDKFRAPRSKPRGTRSKAFDTVLSLMMPVTRDGQRILLPADEAFIVHLREKSRRRDVSASELLAEYGNLIESMLASDQRNVSAIHRRILRPGSVSRPLELLRMAKKFDRHSKNPNLKLEPWIVQAALERLGNKRLSPDEQRTVLAATRTSHKVQWPNWWEVTEVSARWKAR